MWRGWRLREELGMKAEILLSYSLAQQVTHVRSYHPTPVYDRASPRGRRVFGKYLLEDTLNNTSIMLRLAGVNPQCTLPAQAENMSERKFFRKIGVTWGSVVGGCLAEHSQRRGRIEGV